MSKREFQVSVPLDRSQREFVERVAREQDRSIAGAIRHLVVEGRRSPLRDHCAVLRQRCKGLPTAPDLLYHRPSLSQRKAL
jgi:hypothetical protein